MKGDTSVLLGVKGLNEISVARLCQPVNVTNIMPNSLYKINIFFTFDSPEINDMLDTKKVQQLQDKIEHAGQSLNLIETLYFKAHLQ